MTSSSQNLNNLNIHKVNTYKTWKDNYNQNNGIGESDLVIIPPEFILPRPFNSSTGAISNGTNGQFLQTDGSGGVSWATVDALPSQTDNSGKFLTTNGSAASWATVDLSSKADLASPTFTGTPAAPTATAGTNTTQIATTEFVSNAISNIDALPSQSGNSGKYLTTNGTTASWNNLPTEIFWCDYGVTPVSDIESAYQAGKMCLIRGTTDTAAANYNADLAGNIYILNQRFNSDDFVFHTISPWRYGQVITTTALRCTVEYEAISEPSDNPSTEGWYIQESNGSYSLTTDTTVNSSKTYYQKTSNTSWSILRLDYGGGQTVYYGSCTTASATATKAVSLSSFVGDLYKGVCIRVLFSNGNTAANATLKINNLTAQTIQKIDGTSTTSSGYEWSSGEVIDFVYDGSNFIMINGGNKKIMYGTSDLTAGTSSLANEVIYLVYE